jgi:hypothetical protein
VAIRTFQPGDEGAQVSIYNEAAAALPKFKPATLDEVRRRCHASEFDPTTRFLAVANGEPVGYAGFQPNGRISFPWCRSGHEQLTEALFEAVLGSMKQRGLARAFAAYREDWSPIQEFFQASGFQKTRDMVNFMVDLGDMPTPAARRGTAPAPLTAGDIPALLQLAPEILQGQLPADLEKHYLHNPYFPPEAFFLVRNRTDQSLLAVGLLVVNSTYASPRQVDSNMPCFRCGAFGTEGMQVKRINGLFSFVAPPQDASRVGIDLMGHAAHLLRQTTTDAFAAQVPSDAAHLLRFYQSHFRRQGSFPILERRL